MLAELRSERDRLMEAILVLERIVAGGRKRRGRPPKWMAASATSAEDKRPTGDSAVREATASLPAYPKMPDINSGTKRRKTLRVVNRCNYDSFILTTAGGKYYALNSPTQKQSLAHFLSCLRNMLDVRSLISQARNASLQGRSLRTIIDRRSVNRKCVHEEKVGHPAEPNG